MMEIIKNLWLKRRDIVSCGFDESLAYISKIIPLKIWQIPTGTKCWTWVVPEQWEVSEAYIEELSGKRMLSLSDHPFHVMSYSLPIDKVVSRAELMEHLYTKQSCPNAIPFEFKYYERDWGFCLQHSKLKKFNKQKYRVKIKSEFIKGKLKVGELVVKGKIKDEIVVVAHLCHPAMANDDLAGVAVLVELAAELLKRKNKYTYRFLLVPETIGSVAYLSQNEKIIPNIKWGIFLDMLGNDNTLALQHSRQGNIKIDKVAKYVLKKESIEHREGSFRKIAGNDEMVFNGPGVDIPMISLSRFPYPEYHTSADNPSIIKEKNLLQAKSIVLKILDILEKDYIPKRKFKGPIFLSGLGLWADCQRDLKLKQNVEQIMLSLEGNKSAFDIADNLDMNFEKVCDYLEKFFAKGLIEKKQNHENIIC